MIDYKNGKIYRIVCNLIGKQYIGSTCQNLSHRLQNHKNHYIEYLKGKYRWTTSFSIIENNDYDIVLVEDCNVENKEQLHQRERHYIESTENVNKR